MDAPGDASHLDLDELARRLEDLDQGDVLDVAKLATLYSPDSPAHAEEVEEIPADEPVMTMEQLLPSGLSVVISQTCDIRRGPEVEPYLLLAPLSVVDSKTYREASEGLSVRFFAYPPIDGYEDRGELVLDTRAVDSLEKAALLSSHVTHVGRPLGPVERTQLRIWLSKRLGRPVYPDEVNSQIVEPIEKAIKRTNEGGKYSAFYGSVVFYGFRYMPEQAYASLLLLTDAGRREALGVGQPELEAAKGGLQKALIHWARESPYTINLSVHDVTTVPASELLEHHVFVPDIEAASLEQLPRH